MKNKRGLKWVEAIGLVTGTFVFFLFIYLGAKHGGLFSTDLNTKAATVGIERMNIEILELLKSQGYAKAELDFSLPPDFAIVGFNRNWDDKEMTDGCQPDQVTKPQECGDDACLCLYGNSHDDFSEMVPALRCYPIKADYISSLRYYENIGSYKDKVSENIYKNMYGELANIPVYYEDEYNKDYSYFFLYGECDDWSNDEPFGFQPLYIEKYEHDGKIHIFMAFNNEELLRERITELGR